MEATAEERRTEELFQCAMRGYWKGVEAIYSRYPTAQNAKITRSGDTALHIAVADGEQRRVEKLVKLIAESNNKKALGIKNDQGNTPLHAAASLGNLAMCKCIAKADSEVIGVRNNDGETPLFLAALHGRKDAFLCLHSICEGDEGGKGYPFCRRSDGDTILHCAIDGEYFDLAFLILYLYEDLANYRNEEGFSPLHLLATKPLAFRSGKNIGGFREIIYHCLFVAKLEPSTELLLQEFEDRGNKFPENYQTYGKFGRLARNIIGFFVCWRMSNPGGGEQQDMEDPNPKGQQIKAEQETGAQRPRLFAPKYVAWLEPIMLIAKAIFCKGSREIKKIREKKKKHVWSAQLMNRLLQCESLNRYEVNGQNPQHAPSLKGGETKRYEVMDSGHVAFNPHIMSLPSDDDSEGDTNQDTTGGEQSKAIKLDGEENEMPEMGKRETAILIAAKNGVAEMVEKILELFPVAINDMNSEKKNIVLLAVENRQAHVYKRLLEMRWIKDSKFREVDKYGNSALHLAASLGEYGPWLIPGPALQMQWEIKWYEFVKKSKPPHYFVRVNKQGKTAQELFTETHKDLVKSGREWLTKTSESCSVVSGLMATVAFATSAIIPGGVKDSGTPVLQKEPAFDVFAISAFVALCFSVASVVEFLAILTSRYEEKDFRTRLPRKLLIALTSLFVSLTAMVISFCAGHFFVVKDKLKYAAFPLYALTCLLVTLCTVARFPLYFDLIRATFKTVPQRRFKVIPRQRRFKVIPR